MEKLVSLYAQWKGFKPSVCEALPGAGSNRKYYRMSDNEGNSVIGVIGTSREENIAFCTLSRHFLSQSLPVPEVYIQSEDHLRYIQQDLGNRALFDALKQGRTTGEYNNEECQLLLRTIRLLPHMQVRGGQSLDFSVCYPQQAMDQQNIFFDLNYFKYCFLKATGVDFHEMRLEQDFHHLSNELLSGDDCNHATFLYRDFQARNVMLTEADQPMFIDFQGGRRGPLHYDVASFLWQASARYPQSLRDSLLDAYLDELQTLLPTDRTQFRQRLRLFVFFRLLQVLGAYGFRGYFERKRHFIESIPPALLSLKQLLDEGVADAYPELRQALTAVIAAQPAPWKHEGLIVRVFSFSYKKGIPEDVSGNGGGYVFDCRSTNNPGRYAEYKKLTGLDQPVIDFLEKDGEILCFLDNIYPLVDFHVQRWLDRGFQDLQISFGCTGGQHRSVYSAQHVAEHIHRKFGVEVQLCHREQHITQHLTS